MTAPAPVEISDETQAPEILQPVENIEFCTIQHHGNWIAEAALVAYWLGCSSLDRALHLRTIVNSYDALTPFVERLRRQL